MVPTPDGVSIALRQRLSEDGTLRPADVMRSAATSLLDELGRLTVALRTTGRAPLGAAG